jgi:hypothetical protein
MFYTNTRSPVKSDQRRLRASSAIDGGTAPSRGLSRQSKTLATSQGLPKSRESPNAEKRVE